MGKIRILLGIGLLSVTFSVNAGWINIVYDYHCLTAYITNMAAIAAAEEPHTQKVDSINKKQQKIMQYSTAMAQIKEAYRVSMQNIDGFKEESQYYKSIANEATLIVKLCPELYEAFKGSQFPGKFVAATRILSLYDKTSQLVQDFINICTNSTVKNPLSGGKKTESKKDDYNVLDRKQRLGVAIQILSDLRQIRSELIRMRYNLQLCGKEDILKVLDYGTYIRMLGAKNIAENIKHKWSEL